MREMTFFFSHDIRKNLFRNKNIIINYLNFSLILIPNLQKTSKKTQKEVDCYRGKYTNSIMVDFLWNKWWNDICLKKKCQKPRCSFNFLLQTHCVTNKSPKENPWVKKKISEGARCKNSTIYSPHCRKQWTKKKRPKGIVDLDLRWNYDVKLFCAKKQASDWLTCLVNQSDT